MTNALCRFPLSNRVVVHATAGRQARHVQSLTGSSDWRRNAADRLGAAVVGIVGTRHLPPVDAWPWPHCTTDELIDELQGALPGLRILGAAIPRQVGRERLSVLARAAGTLTVIKLGGGADAGSLRTEAHALRLLRANPLPGIATPHVFADGVLRGLSDGDDVEFLATTSVAITSQRPAIDAPLITFSEDLAIRLADLPRPAGASPEAAPVHGDLTPWNLRRTRRGLALFDWEAAGWGDPAADIELYRRTCDEIRPGWRRRPEWLR